MAGSPFHDIHDALIQAAAGIAETSDGLPSGTSGEGLAAEAIRQKLMGWKQSLSHEGEHMKTNADGPVSTLASADDDLMRAPSPLMVEHENEKWRTARIMVQAGQMNPKNLKPIHDRAQQVRDERAAALERHTASIVEMDDYTPLGDEAQRGGGYTNPYGSSTSAGGINGAGGSGGGGIGGGSAGGGAVGASGIGTAISGSDGAGGGSRVSMAQPGSAQSMMPPMPMQPQGAAPGGGMPGAVPPGGMLAGGGVPNYNKKKPEDKDAIPTGLSGAESGAAGAAVAAAGVDRGGSITGANTKSDISGKNAPVVSATGTNPNAGGAGGRGGGAMMGGGMGGMGSGAGMGGNKPKANADVTSRDPAAYGFDEQSGAVRNGRIERDTAEPDDFEDWLGEKIDEANKKGKKAS